MTASAHDDPRSDGELVDAINTGDEGAFEALYYRYRDWVHSLATRFTHDHDLALDVLQETFAYVLRKCPGLKLTAEMKTFLYPVIKHTAIALRKKSLRFVSDDEALTNLDAPPDPPADSHGDPRRSATGSLPASADPLGDPRGGPRDASPRAELASALRLLPPEQRETLLMRFVDDMTLQEIADALSIPLGTVKSRLHHALKTLREHEHTRRYFDEA